MIGLFKWLIVIWVLQMNEEDNHTEIIEKINKATYAYNNDVLNGKKKNSRKNLVYKVSESLEQVTAKYFKERKFLLRPKNRYCAYR